MASPSLVSQTFSQSAGVTDTAFTPTLSTHAAGEMLELDVGLDGNPTVSFATGGQNGWTLHWQLQNTQGSTTPTHAKLSKRATSSSETPPDLESSVGEAWGASCRVYQGSGGTLNYYTPTPVDGTDSGSSTNGQGSAVAPGVGSQDFTFTSCIVQDGVQGATAGPSGYGNFQTNANATAARVEVSTSEKAATASSDTPGAWTSAAEQWIVGGGAVWEDAGGGSQTLSPPLVTRTRTIYAPTVTTGAVSLSPPLVTRTRTVYAPTVTTSNTLAPPLVTRTRTVYSPTLTVGPVSLSPPLVTRTRTVYAPTVTQPGAGTQTLSPPLVTRTRTVYAPVVVPGDVDVLPPLVTRTRTVYAPTVTTSITISPPLVTRGRVVYAPTVTVGAVTLFPPLVTRSRAVYAPTVTGGDPVVATGGLFLPIVRRRRR